MPLFTIHSYLRGAQRSDVAKATPFVSKCYRDIKQILLVSLSWQCLLPVGGGNVMLTETSCVRNAFTPSLNAFSANFLAQTNGPEMRDVGGRPVAGSAIGLLGF